MRKILVICAGNICRSPAGEGILRAELTKAGFEDDKDFFIDSAGTGAWHAGQAPDERSQAVCRAHGIDISSYRARALEPADGEIFDELLVMDSANLQDVKAIIQPEHHHKIAYFDPSAPVPDPYYGGPEGLEKMFEQLSKAAVCLAQ